MKRTTIAAVILCTLLTGLAGCGQQSTTTADTAQSTSSSSTQADSTAKTVMGRITAVSGSTITLETMGGGMHGGPDGQGGGKGGDAPSGNTTGSAPSGNAPSGNAPSGDNQQASMSGSTNQTPPQGGKADGDSDDQQKGGTSETTTITLVDKTEVWTESNGQQTSASASDLKVGDNVKITYATDGTTVDSIVIMPAMQQGQGDAQGAASDNTTATASTASDSTAK